MTIDTILFYDIQVNKIILLLLKYLLIDLFILKNMGAAIIDFRVCPPLVKCKNLMFSGFMVSLVQVSQYTVISAWNSMITPAVKWFVNRYNDNDIMTTNKLPGIFFFFNYRYIPHTKSVWILLDKKLHALFSLFCCFSSIRKKG